MKHFTFLLTAVLLSTASLTACSEESMSIQERTEQRFKLNPNPQEAYRIRIKINDAPGPLKPMNDNYIRYMARNCSYVINEFAGATAHPKKYIDTPIRQIGQNEYEIVFYFDAVQDEDYFGEGVCKWKPDGYGGTFKATGKEEETAFSISEVMGNLIEKKTITKYYWKARYPLPITKLTDYIDYGSDSIGDFSEENQKNLFTITATLEEIK